MPTAPILLSMMQPGGERSDFFLTEYNPGPGRGHFPLAQMRGVTTVKAARDKVVLSVKCHDPLLAALRGLQANPNDPRAHRAALDAMNLVEQERKAIL